MGKNDKKNNKLMLISIVTILVIAFLLLLKFNFFDKGKFKLVNKSILGDVSDTLNNNEVTSPLRLSSLSVEGYDDILNFDSDTFNYSINVPYNVDSLNITADSENATVEISPYPIALIDGENNINISLSSEGYEDVVYTILVNKEEELGLRGIALSEGELNQTFDKEIYQYEVHIAGSFDEFVITPITGTNTIATVVPPTIFDDNINLYEIDVIYDQNISKLYTITVIKDFSARLSSLSIDDVDLLPEFSPSKLNYTAYVDSSVSSVQFRYEPIEGCTVTEFTGNPSELDEGDNLFTITVTDSSDESKTYNITIKKINSFVNTLDDLEINNGEVSLTPAFNSEQENYTAQVPYEISSINISTTKTNPNSSVWGDGTRYLNNVGENDIKVIVTGENGTQKVYTITVTRESKSTIPNLDIDGEYVIFTNNKTVGQIKSIVGEGYTIVVTSNGETLNDDDSISTEDIIRINNEEYIIVLLGDFNSNGLVNSFDVYKMYEYIYYGIKGWEYEEIITPAQLKAADYNRNGVFNNFDVYTVYSVVLGSGGSND